MIEKIITIIISFLSKLFGFLKAKKIKELKYIKQERIEPEMFADDHCIDYDMPTIFCGFPKQTFLMLTGKAKPEKYLNVKKVKDIKMIKVPVPEGIDSGVICYFKNTVKIDLHIPRGIIPVEVVRKALLATVVKTLKLQRFNPVYESNDLLINIDGKLRKFCGFFHCELRGWDYYALPVSFKIDYDLIKDVYKLDTQKMIKKGKVEEISDVIMGLDEIGITGKEAFLDSFIENLAQRFNWKIIKDNFSTKEKNQLKKLR